MLQRYMWPVERPPQEVRRRVVRVRIMDGTKNALEGRDGIVAYLLTVERCHMARFHDFPKFR